MAQYYFIAAALPPLSLDARPELSLKELREMLLINAAPADLKKVEYLLRPIDLSNIRAFWMGMPLDERGNFSPKELEEALLVRDSLPEYLIEYLERYELTAERLRNFSSLYVSLFRDTQPKLNGFLLKYYVLERQIRLILTALRAKRSGRDVVRELQFEDPTDLLVAEILAQKDMSDYTPPEEFESLKALFVAHVDKPKELQRALLEYRFAKYQEMEENEFFSMDRILGYMARLLLVESWVSLDEEAGKQTIDDLSRF
jgi:hypothetical protein